MKNFLEKSLLLIGALISVLLISSCGAIGSGSGGKINIEATQASLAGVSSKCKLEKVDLQKSGKVKGFVRDKLLFERLVDNLSDYSQLLDNPENTLATYKDSGYDVSPEENVFSWNLNSLEEIYVCNTEGLALSSFEKWAEEIGNQFDSSDWDKCNHFYSPYDSRESKEAKDCLRKMDSIKRNGEWIVLVTTKGISPENLISTFMKSHNKIWPASKGEQARLRAPLAYTENFSISFADSGSYWTSNQNLIRNNLWKSVVKALNAKTWNVLDEENAGYSADYSNTWVQDLDLRKAANREDISATDPCSTPLKISENSAMSSECGKLSVEVFQSDLNTGSCAFLGYWSDKFGSRKIGIFRYCDVFKSGSFIEDGSYKIRVQVDGPESYTTATGARSRVLSFTVMGNG